MQRGQQVNGTPSFNDAVLTLSHDDFVLLASDVALIVCDENMTTENAWSTLCTRIGGVDGLMSYVGCLRADRKAVQVAK